MTSSWLNLEPTDSFPYRVVQQAGEGAMGTVYRAVDTTLDRSVAIKVLKLDDERQMEAGSESRQRFLQEARAAAALTHPGVTTVHQVGHKDKTPYIVMEWIEGTTLEDMVERQGPLPLEQAGRYVMDLLDILASAHAAGVVHRDIKPSNLMVLPDGRLKVTDFGIAQLQGSNLVKTLAGSVLATPSFASPEQMQGLKVDGRSDLFSTAVVFYHLLTGALPWQRDNLMKFMQALLNESYEPLRSHRPELPLSVETWFGHALERDRDQRFPDAQAMAESIIPWVPNASASGSHRTHRPGTSTGLVPEGDTTLMMAPPASLFVAQGATSPWQILGELLRSWEEQSPGTMDRQSFLAKLLDKPLHTDAFAGAALFGNYCLLVEDGIVLLVFDMESGQMVPDAQLDEQAAVRLFFLPKDRAAGTVSLLASLLTPGVEKHNDLDSLVVKLPALIGQLLSERYEGIMELRGGDVTAYLLLQGGQVELALLSSGWAEDPRQVNWSRWLGSLSVKARVYGRNASPPAFWFRQAYAQRQVVLREIQPLPKTTGKGSSAITLVTAFGEIDRIDGRLFHLESSDPPCPAGPVCLADAPAFKVLDWMVATLPRLLVERQRAKPWKYLADWLLHISRATLHSDLERPGQNVSDYFDIVTEDPQGKILHIAHRLPNPTADGLRELVDRIIAAKEARIKGGDIGGALIIAPSFPQAVVDAYKSYLGRGFGNQLLGLDRSMGYEGFVRLSSRRGFHLLLVQETAEGHRPRFNL